MARDAEPIFYQLFLSGTDAAGNVLEHRAGPPGVVRPQARRARARFQGRAPDTIYFPSLSART